MRSLTSLVLLLLSLSPAAAQDCPPYYRFVDFGLKDRGGVLHRGGHLFRVEGFDGTPMLIRDRTICRTVQQLAIDGHAHPIPVISQFEYDPVRSVPALGSLRLSATKDARDLAEENAERHRTRLRQPDMPTVRSQTFLCAGHTEELSCQLQSPYPGNLPLVVYCDATTCKMPALAFNPEIVISASWNRDPATLTDAMATGAQAQQTTRDIRDFLEIQY